MVIISCALKILEYILAEYLFLNGKVKRPIAYVIGLSVFSATTFIPALSADAKYLLVYIVVPICCFFSMQGKWKSRILPAFILFFVVTAVDGIVQFFYNLILYKVISRDMFDLYCLCKDVMSIALVFTGVLIKRLVRKDFIDHWIRSAEKHMDFSAILTAMIITFTISLLEYSQNMISNEKYQHLSTVVSGIAYISIVFLVGMAIYVKHLNEEQKTLMNNELMMKDIQKKYYEALLDQEKDTRAYRHDMANHMLCLSALAEKGDLPALRTYLDDLLGEFQRIKGRTYRTGNEILDIMSNFFLPQLSDKIEINFQVAAVSELDEMKICTIYANLIQNAVEELKSDPDRPGKLDIIFKQKDEVCRLMIANSIFREKGKDILATQKTDKKNHGLGLKNVERVVDDLGGKMWITTEDQLFKVLVEIKIKDRSRT